jgi:hypothetical protein
MSLRRVPLWALVAHLAACSGSGDARAPLASEAPQQEAGGAVVSTDWVRLYDPERAWGGYTLDLFWGRVPTLVDMNGRIVHAWPEARVRSRVRLLPDGSLLGLSLARSVVEYDWEGRLTWQYDCGERLPHHDVRRLANGNVLVPVLDRTTRSDDLLEIDRQGNVVWEWHSAVHLAHLFTREVNRMVDRTHINSVQELPENIWFRNGDERFRPGNVLVSSRSLNAALLIDRRTGAVVWVYNDQLDRQHEALMIEPGRPGAGNVLIFDNEYGSQYRYRSSQVRMIRPTDGALVWSYAAGGFYSPTVGLQQALPNGNVLIASSRGKRTFEVTRDGEIVWQWAPPFEPVRPERYAYDATPQLAALGPPEEARITPPDGYLHVDRRSYEFARRGALRKVKLETRPEIVLADNNACRRVLLPSRPTVWVSYGVSAPQLVEAGRKEFVARFAVTVQVDGGERETRLFEDTVGFAPPRWREQTLDLSPFALRWATLCVRTEEVGAEEGSPTEPLAFWSNPHIRQADDADQQAQEFEEAALTPEELDAQREHLRALGYIQ